MSEVGSDALSPTSNSPAAVAEPLAAQAASSTSQGRQTAVAPATSSTSGLPKSFREAMDQWDADQEPPSAQRSPNGPDPAVTGDGAASVAAAAPDPVQLETQIRTKVEAELKNDPRYQVAQQFDPAEFAGAVDQLRLMQQNPVEFYRRFGEELKQAGMLQPDPAQQPFSLPDADLEAEDGTKAYSAERLAEIVTGLQRQIDAKIQPFEQERAARQREQQQAQTMTRAKATVDEAAKKYDGFNELRPQIVQEMLRDKQTGRFRSLEQVYLDVYHTQYLPTRDEKVRQQHAESLRAKAAATATRPTGGVPRGGPAGPAKTFRQAIERNGGAAVADNIFGR